MVKALPRSPTGRIWNQDEDLYCPGSGIVVQKRSIPGERARCPECGRRIGLDRGAIRVHLPNERVSHPDIVCRINRDIRVGITGDDCELIRKLIDGDTKPKDKQAIEALREKIAW